jgi:alpha-1,4-digalacturonate transport system substrate-binding protein
MPTAMKQTVMQAIVDRFMADNPDIKVILDVVPYATIDEQLPVQVETGQGPDLARITNFGAYRGKLLDLRPFLADPAYFEANFPAPVLAAMRVAGDATGPAWLPRRPDRHRPLRQQDPVRPGGH